MEIHEWKPISDGTMSPEVCETCGESSYGKTPHTQQKQDCREIFQDKEGLWCVCTKPKHKIETRHSGDALCNEYFRKDDERLDGKCMLPVGHKEQHTALLMYQM